MQYQAWSIGNLLLFVSRITVAANANREVNRWHQAIAWNVIKGCEGSEGVEGFPTVHLELSTMETMI